MSQPSFSCPRCGYETFLPSDVAAGYCPSCRWWTGDSLLGSDDVLAQAEIDGPFAPPPWETRAEIEADWFAQELAPAEIHARELSARNEARIAECRAAPAYSTWEPDRRLTPPTYRVARFVRALRRLRR